MPSTGRDTGYTPIEDRHTEERTKVSVSKGRRGQAFHFSFALPVVFG